MNVKKFFLSFIITILTVAIIFGGFSAAQFFGAISTSKPGSDSVFDPLEKGKMNILLMGLDEGKTRSDTIMLACLDKKAKTAKIISIPRDTRVKVNGRSIKINSTMGYKSRVELMVSKVKELTGIPINYYAAVDFAGFIEIINILGGVDYDVPYDMNYDDPYQNLSIHFKKGMQHLDGQAAHDYVRFRQNNYGTPPGNYALGDPGRIEAQQAFLKELVRQKLKFRYIIKAPSLAKSVSKYLETNVDISKALTYIGTLKKALDNGFETYMLPGEPQMIGGGSYYICNTKKTKELVAQEFGYIED